MSKDAIREAAEEAVEELGFSATHHVSKADAIEIVNSFIRAEVDAERERCIKILEDPFRYDWHSQFDDTVKEMREEPK